MLQMRAWIGLVVAFSAGMGALIFIPHRNTPLLAAPETFEALTADTVTLRDLESACDRLGVAGDTRAVKTLLEPLALRLKSAPPDRSAPIILQFLAQRRDAPTQMPFTVGNGGILTTAPTFRVWLMDQLARISPINAAEYAAQILTVRDSADEWAIALRDYARAKTAPDNITFLRGKTRELLQDPRWQAQQSEGWLEAFDVAVYTGATELTPEFSKFLREARPEDRALIRAARSTLDRLTQLDPAMMLSQFMPPSELLQSQEMARACLFTRADVRDPRQRSLVEQYLLSPDVSQEELAKFANLFPNANFMVSKNLLTVYTPPNREDWVSRDRGALAVVSEWMANPRFKPIHPHIEVIHSRLSSIVLEEGF